MKKRWLAAIVCGLYFIMLQAACSGGNANTPVQPPAETTTATVTTTVAGKLTVHFIDVGQADAILVQQGNVSMLIDAGNKGDAGTVTGYLRKQGVTRLDRLVLTHPHEDHIGGAEAVINSFGIGNLYMPRVTATTRAFEDVAAAIKNKNLKAAAPDPGTEFTLGTAACRILAPNGSNYEDINNYSIVIKLVFGNNSFLFTGDAQEASESEMLGKGFDLKAGVLKIGHHGSSNSTSGAFLKAVSPEYAVISVGKGNDYGHPHKETMDKLKANGIIVYRTDECGTVVAASDGNNITFNTKPGSYSYIGTGSKPNAGEAASDATRPAAPLPGTGAGVSVAASVDDSSPAQNSRITLTVTGPKDAPFTAVCHYKSKDTTYTGKAGVPVSIPISQAAKGFKVIIDVTVTVNGSEYPVQTSFTPR